MMRFGLDERTIRAIGSVFAEHPCVERAVLYGSRAKGTHKPGSDIDLTLHGEAITSQEMDRIADELDALDLPYTIDLSLFARLTHAPLRDHIERAGQEFYVRRSDG